MSVVYCVTNRNKPSKGISSSHTKEMHGCLAMLHQTMVNQNYLLLSLPDYGKVSQIAWHDVVDPDSHMGRDV
jgi:hypothetical protein